MKAAGEHRASGRGKIIAIVVIATAVVMGVYAWRAIITHPSTDDASIDADVVHVAALVGGRIIQIPVVENSAVRKGDLLFQIDPLPYQLAVAQAEANLALAKGDLDSRQRMLSTERSNATIAGEQTIKARQNGELAARTVDRLGPLATQGFVPTEEFDQAQVKEQDAVRSLKQAEEQQSAALRAIGTEEAAVAAVHAGEAALGIAKRELDNTTVRAPHDGRVVGLTVVAGETVIPSQSLFTLIDTEEWYAVGNFRETELKYIAPGNCVTAYSMIDRRQPVKGIVQGIGWGVVDQDRVNLPRSVPYVERSLNWVRVEQRFPVRVRLVDPPQPLMRLGASAVVQIKHGAACR